MLKTLFENTVRPLLSSHPRDFESGRLIEVQYKWIGRAVNMILLTLYNKMLLKSEHIYEDKSKIHWNKTSSAFPAHA